MSLILDTSNPPGLEVKTFGFGSMGNTVHIGDYEISPADFKEMVIYVLTNTDLEPDDPRLELVRVIQAMIPVAGHNPGRDKLAIRE